MNITINSNVHFVVEAIHYTSDGEIRIELSSEAGGEDKRYRYAASLGSGEAEEQPRISLMEYISRHVERKSVKESTKGSYRLMQKHLGRYGDTTLDKVTTPYLEEFIRYMEGENLSAGTVRLFFQKLSCVLHEAYREGLFDERVLQRVQRPRRPREKKGFLTEAELRRMVHCRRRGKSDKVETMFLFSCLTGLRFSDVCALRWRDVRRNGKHLQLEFRQRKTGTVESLPLCEGAEALLKSRERKGEYVFGAVSNQSANGVVRRWSRRAGVKKAVTYHTSRHTFCVLLVTRDVPIFTIQQLMCHSDIGTTEVYTDILSRTKSKAVRRLPLLEPRSDAV